MLQRDRDAEWGRDPRGGYTPQGRGSQAERKDDYGWLSLAEEGRLRAPRLPLAAYRLLLDAELPEQERPGIGAFLDLFAYGFALAVAGFGLDAQQDRPVRTVGRGGLHARRHLAGVQRVHKFRPEANSQNATSFERVCITSHFPSRVKNPRPEARGRRSKAAAILPSLLPFPRPL